MIDLIDRSRGREAREETLRRKRITPRTLLSTGSVTEIVFENCSAE